MKKRIGELLKTLRSSAVGIFLERELPPARWIRRVVSAVAIFLVTLAVLMAVMDPCFHYHNWKFIPRIYTQEYWQIPGVLRTFDYDSVIIGSSTSRSFNLAVFRRELGIRPVKATASACTAHSGRVFAETAIRFNPKLKQVYYGLDLFIFFSPSDFDQYPLPEFLYSRSRCRDFSYLWNFDIIYTFLQNVQWELGSLIKGDGQFTNPDLMFAGNYLGNIRKHGRTPVVKAVRRDTFRLALLAAKSEKSEALRHFAENLECNIVPPVRDNPSVEFVFFLPPSSALNFADAEMHGTLELFLHLRRMIAERLLAFPNVRLYDFQIAPETLSVDNYKDLVHFVPAINDAMVSWIRQDKYRVRTPADIDANNRVLMRYAREQMPLFKSILDEAGKN